MYYQPDIETMPREQLRELQLERMRRSIRHAYDNVAFYQRTFKEAGITPDDLTSLEDLTRFPFVVKQDMRDAYPFGLFAVPQKDVARIHASSGTTGQATVVGHTKTVSTSGTTANSAMPAHSFTRPSSLNAMSANRMNSQMAQYSGSSAWYRIPTRIAPFMRVRARMSPSPTARLPAVYGALAGEVFHTGGRFVKEVESN